MFERYRPAALEGGNGQATEGNGQATANQSEPPLEIPAKVVDPAEPLAKVVGPPITHKAGDERSPSFWSLFASGEPEQPVEKRTAVFVAKTIVDEAVGGARGNAAITAFKNDQITVSDVLATIDRLCGGPAGWQLCRTRETNPTANGPGGGIEWDNWEV